MVTIKKTFHPVQSTSCNTIVMDNTNVMNKTIVMGNNYVAFVALVMLVAVLVYE
ncbi:hypothetical protein NPM01_25195 [Bacillus cereus]|nr:hypothetical protein [Bacillus cereus]